ncbi:PAAR domain-containing protein [Burkholderia sp. L27(2015)]|uniref:PAAR domain-containing protein n=1 Tax=Burkholderia sp. L27(2015) TaxID=1641858 RepID=UPI00131A83C2|nr:PAAR domain-containing protein [Burkholderia sp. L27(2015)]
MGIYYSAVEGDPLDSGGNGCVIEGASNFTIEGEDGRSRNQAFIGHKAYCDACKSVGPIVAAPGSPDMLRMHDSELGQREALGGDLVLCKCERRPRIIAVHGRSCRIDDGGGEATASATNATTTRAARASSFDDRYVLRTVDGTPICNTRYAIQRGDGAPEIGQTDDQGRTHLPAAIDSEEDVHVYLGGAA